MDALERLAEQKLEAAIAAGEFAALPGAGQPLELEDLAGVEPELRGGYLLLKGAGVLPEEMALAKELLTLGDLLRACEDEGRRATLEERRRGLALRYELLMERRRGC
ncbi:MAG TPA: DnaJ family domain-containing protein [Planctomycetota bacterium]